MKGDLDVIKQRLLDDVVPLCRKFLPDGRLEGGSSRWMAHDPVAGEYKKAPSLSVVVSGPKKGRWRNFRGTVGDAKHDLIGLIAYVEKTDTSGALAIARDFLGMKSLSADAIRRMRVDTDKRREEAEREAEAERRKSIKRGQDLFRKSTRPFAPPLSSSQGSSLAGAQMAERYFAARQVPIDQVRSFARENFRFSQATEYWRKAQWSREGGRLQKLADGPVYPAVHSALRGPAGTVTACHVTFLDPLRPAKAPEEPAKLVRGEQTGAVIEIAHGRTGRAFHETEQAGDVIICEGIETGLSLAIAVPEARVWAAGSITNMANCPVHLPAVGRIFVARDNNHGNATAQEQLERSVDQLDQAGKPLVVMASHVGDDFNDLMQGDDDDETT